MTWPFFWKSYFVAVVVVLALLMLLLLVVVVTMVVLVLYLGCDHVRGDEVVGLVQVIVVVAMIRIANC